MKCQEVEPLLFELAHAADAPAEALRHLDACPHCAALVSAERSVSAGLRLLADADKGASASGQVEAALLVAFRAQAATAAEVQPFLAPAKTRASWLPIGSLWQRKLVFASACAVALVLLVVMLLRFQLAPRPQTPQTAKTNLHAQPHQPPTPANDNKEEQRAEQQPEQRGAGPAPFIAAATPPKQSTKLSRRRGRQARLAPERVPELSVGTLGEMEVLAHARDVEHVTPFVPLVAGGAPLASGQVVRVSVPPSALASLGLTVNPADGASIKADVLLGEDGQASAIRFIR